MKKLITSLLVLTSIHTFAWVSVGTFVPNFLNSQGDSDGSSTKFRINPFISFDYVTARYFGHHFNPEIGIVFNTDAEDETSHKTIFLQYNFEYPVNAGFTLRWGVSNFIDRIGGDGKTVQLNNGTGTQTFYTPNETQSSYTSSFNLGAKLFVSSKYAIRFDTNITSFLSSEKRALNYLLSLNIY